MKCKAVENEKEGLKYEANFAAEEISESEGFTTT
jgi:hypothetical protein